MLNGYRTLAATGRILGVSAQRVLDLIERGPLVGRSVDGELKVHAEDLMSFRRPAAIATTRNNSPRCDSELLQEESSEGSGDASVASTLTIRPCGEPGFQARRGTMASKSYRLLADLLEVRRQGERFLLSVVVDAVTECHARGKKRDGYSTFRMWPGGTVPAHRFAWVLANNRVIPERHDVDHTCHHRWCVNGAHLEAVTHAENIRRRDAGGKDNCVAARAVLAAGRHLRLVQNSDRGNS